MVDVVGGGYALPVGDTWVVKLNTGTFYSEETFSRGRDVAVVRGGSALTDYTVQLTLKPVRMAFTNDGCGGMGVCPSVANHTAPGYLEISIDDAGFAIDPAYKASLHNFDLASNADWISSPMQLDYVTNTIKLDVSNAHFEADGTTVFRGRTEFTLPNAMLTSLYNVDDPATLTPAAFAVTTGGGPAATTTVAIGSGVVHVVIDGLTFSKRVLRIIGRTQPRQPGNLTAVRTTASRGVIRSSGSLRRGSKVRSYLATCSTRGHSVRAQTKLRGKFKLRLSGLLVGRRYRCVIRARSHAGLGTAGHINIPAAVAPRA